MSTPESGAGNDKTDATGTPDKTEQGPSAESTVATPAPAAAPSGGDAAAPVAAPAAPGFAAPQGGADSWWTPPRPPRQRWIAPARRTPVILIASAGGLALFGLGIIVGALVGDHRDHRQMPMFRQDGFTQFQRGPNGGPGFGPGQGFGDQNDRRFPMGPGQMGPYGQFPGPNSSASATPRPSASS